MRIQGHVGVRAVQERSLLVSVSQGSGRVPAGAVLKSGCQENESQFSGARREMGLRGTKTPGGDWDEGTGLHSRRHLMGPSREG